MNINTITIWHTNCNVLKLKLNTMLMMNMKIHSKILNILKKVACVIQRLMYAIMKKNSNLLCMVFFKCHLVCRYLH